LSLQLEWIEVVSFANELETCMYWGGEKRDDGSLTGWNQVARFEDAVERGMMNFTQDARLLGRHVSRTVVKNGLSVVRERRPMEASEIDWFLPHYSSEYFRQQVYDRLEEIDFVIPYERWFTNLVTKGNTGAASIYLMLDELFHSGKLQPGQKVLVVGASGGVGSYAVQLAKALGGGVTGVAGTHNLELVRSLGADDVIDYTAEELGDRADRYDLIIDTGGRNSIRRLRSVLASHGTLVIVGGEGGGKWTGGVGRQLRAMIRSLFTRQRLTSMISKEDRAFIEPLADHMARGEVVPAIGQPFQLDQVPEALRQMAAGALSGKTVIVVKAAGTDVS